MWRMRILLVSLACAACVWAQEPNVTTGGLKLVKRQEYEKAATGALKQLESALDAEQLDRFIAKYPESTAAGVAFAARASYLRGVAVTDEHHRFIARYRDRIGSQLAIADVFRIYRKAHRLSAYLDFMRRYPAVPEAAVARLQVHQLAFELARELNTSADFDAFARMFPDAAHRPAAEALAEERAIEEERALYEAAKKKDPEKVDAWVNKRLRNYVFESRDLWAAATQPEPTRQVRKYVEENVLGGPLDTKSAETRHYLAQRVARVYSIVRSIEPYRMHLASDQILAETRHQELITKLTEIQAELARQREDMQALLRQEFEETRRVIEVGFEALVKQHRLDRDVLVKGVRVLAAGMDRLHADLVAVHGEIRGLRISMNNVDQGIRQANAMLGRLDQQLSVVNANLRQINADLNYGFDRVSAGIENMRADMNANFDRQAEIAWRQLDVAHASLDVQTQTLYTVDRGFKQVDMTLRAGFTRMEDATWGAASQIVQSNRQMVSRLAKSSRRKKRGVNKELLSAALGTAATFAGAGPILGPVVGDMAGQLLTDGTVDPLSLGKTAVSAAAGKRFAKIPGADRLAGAVFDSALGQRQKNYARTAQAFEGRTGIRRPNQPPWPEVAAGCNTEQQFRELEQRIAQTYRTTPRVIGFCAKRIY
jgi:hypothetical protein